MASLASRSRKGKRVPAYVQPLWDALKGVRAPQTRDELAKELARGLHRLVELWAKRDAGQMESREAFQRASAEQIGLFSMLLLPKESQEVLQYCLDFLHGCAVDDELPTNVREARRLLCQATPGSVYACLQALRMDASSAAGPGDGPVSDGLDDADWWKRA